MAISPPACRIFRGRPLSSLCVFLETSEPAIDAIFPLLFGTVLAPHE
jgi:hypothetical protein